MNDDTVTNEITAMLGAIASGTAVYLERVNQEILDSGLQDEKKAIEKILV